MYFSLHLQYMALNPSEELIILFARGGISQCTQFAMQETFFGISTPNWARQAPFHAAKSAKLCDDSIGSC